MAHVNTETKKSIDDSETKNSKKKILIQALYNEKPKVRNSVEFIFLFALLAVTVFFLRFGVLSLYSFVDIPILGFLGVLVISYLFAFFITTKYFKKIALFFLEKKLGRYFTKAVLSKNNLEEKDIILIKDCIELYPEIKKELKTVSRTISRTIDIVSYVRFCEKAIDLLQIDLVERKQSAEIALCEELSMEINSRDQDDLNSNNIYKALFILSSSSDKKVKQIVKKYKDFFHRIKKNHYDEDSSFNSIDFIKLNAILKETEKKVIFLAHLLEFKIHDIDTYNDLLDEIELLFTELKDILKKT